MTHADFALTSLCIYREARGEGNAGMTAVACVIRNRTHKHGSTPFLEVIRPLAFSSITAKNDPQLGLFPKESDMQWSYSQTIAENVLNDVTADVTGGATLYFSPRGMAANTTVAYTLPDGSITPFPKSWNPSAVQFSVKIGAHLFFREV